MAVISLEKTDGGDWVFENSGPAGLAPVVNRVPQTKESLSRRGESRFVTCRRVPSVSPVARKLPSFENTWHVNKLAGEALSTRVKTPLTGSNSANSESARHKDLQMS